MGQFLDHDIVLSHLAEPLEVAAIAVPAGDIFFDLFATGDKRMGFFESEYGITTGVNSPRQQVNFITAWIDGYSTHGSDDQTANQLRTFVQEKLRPARVICCPKMSLVSSWRVIFGQMSKLVLHRSTRCLCESTVVSRRTTSQYALIRMTSRFIYVLANW